MSEKNLRNLPISQVRPNEVALRAVNKETEKYIGLVESVKVQGIILPVAVCEKKDPNTGVKYFALIDGLHRYTAAVDAGLDTLPCHILVADEIQQLEMQIVANFHVIKTSPIQFSNQLYRLIAIHPTFTYSEIGHRLGQSETWVKNRLGLINLTEPIKDLVENNEINITNAYHLSKLPKEEQANFVDRAITMVPDQFISLVSNRQTELKQAKRQGRLAGSSDTFTPQAFLQKISDITSETESVMVGRGLINQYGLTDPVDSWKMALLWVRHLDPISVEIQRVKEEERKKQAKIAAAERKAEREKKNRLEAAAIGATLDDFDTILNEDE